jgi:hypothetical protein
LAFRLDRESLRPLWALPLQQIAYRQIMYAVLLHSMVTAATGGRLRWQKLNRTGQAAQSAPPGASPAAPSPASPSPAGAPPTGTP